MICWEFGNLHLLWFICLGRQQQLEAEQQYVDADQDLHRTERTVEPPTERPGERRMAEMKKLYGAEADKIQAMEAALQLIFDRNCDKKQPKYWPIIPLKLWVPGLCSDLVQSCREGCLRLCCWKNRPQIWGLVGLWGRGCQGHHVPLPCSPFTLSVSNDHNLFYLHAVVK